MCVWLVCVWGVYLPSQIPVSIGSLAGCRCLKSTLNKHLGWNLATCVYRQPLNLPKWGVGLWRGWGRRDIYRTEGV